MIHYLKMLIITVCYLSINPSFLLGIGSEDGEKEATNDINSLSSGEKLTEDDYTSLGLLYYYGIRYHETDAETIEQNPEAGLAWFAEAAARRNDVAQFLLNTLHPDSLNRFDKGNLYRLAVESGDPTIQCALGIMYQKGAPFGIEQNNEFAFNLFRIAAERGYRLAQLYLARIYYFRQDFETATKWYSRAAAPHPAQISINLEVDYIKFGISEDLFMKMAFEDLQAETDACMVLSSMYTYGIGTPQDPGLAEEFSRFAIRTQSSEESRLRQFDLFMNLIDTFNKDL